MEDEEKCESRRGFIIHLAGGLLTVSMTGSFIAEKVIAATHNPGNALATVNIEEHQELQHVGGYILMKKTPVGDLLIVRSGEDEYSALSVVCPHLQCNVKVKSPVLIQCPCHQSGYKLDGSYISGPAKTGLKKFPLTVEDGALTVWAQKP